jgi:hypothetical protein
MMTRLRAGAIALLFAFFVTLLVAANPVASAAECLRYEPQIETLRGQLNLRSYSDRTESTGEKQTVMVLDLPGPICVQASSADDINVEEHDVRRVQVVYDPKARGELHRLLRKQVLLTGTLYHAHTAQHHETVLIKVSSAKAAPR